jgi:hypothetical protein
VSTGNVYRAELSRFVHRRAVRNCMFATLIAFVVAILAVAVLFAPTGADVVTGAKAAFAQMQAGATAAYDSCVAATPVGQRLSQCGVPGRDLGDYTQFMPVKTFTLDVAMPTLARLLGFFFAIMAFAVGAVWIGAEWTWGSVALSALWTPNRFKLIMAKIGVLAGAVAAMAAALQGTWIVTSLVLARFRGAGTAEEADWGATITLDIKLVLVAVGAALVGFAISSIARNSVAAIAAALVYALGAEGGLRLLSPTLQRWFVSDNVNAFLHPGGINISWGEGIDTGLTHLSAVHATLLAAAVITSLLVVVVAVFRRSDLT